MGTGWTARQTVAGTAPTRNRAQGPVFSCWLSTRPIRMPNIPTLMPVLGLLATAVAAFVIILKGLVIPVLLALLVYAWSCWPGWTVPAPPARRYVRCWNGWHWASGPTWRPADSRRASGTISAINRGERRVLQSVVIEVGDESAPDAALRFAHCSPDKLGSLSGRGQGDQERCAADRPRIAAGAVRGGRAVCRSVRPRQVHAHH